MQFTTNLRSFRNHPQNTCADLPGVLLFAAVVQNIEADLTGDLTQNWFGRLDLGFPFEHKNGAVFVLANRMEAVDGGINNG